MSIPFQWTTFFTTFALLLSKIGKVVILEIPLVHSDALFGVFGPTFTNKLKKGCHFDVFFDVFWGHFHEKCAKREIRCKVTKQGSEKMRIATFSGGAFGALFRKNV